METKYIYKSKKKFTGTFAANYHGDKAQCDEDRVTYFDHKEMIIGIKISVKHKFFNKTSEVILTAVYNGYQYSIGLDKYKSERSLQLRINHFVKYIINDTQNENKK
jgi:hypothetical protein